MQQDNNNVYYVYLHRRADDNEVFYVGKGKKCRATSKHSRNDWWKRVVLKHGFIVEYVEKEMSEQSALDLEVELIKFYRECGHTLCNLTDGGDGVSGYKYSPESRAKLSLLISKPVVCSNGMTFGNSLRAVEWLVENGKTKATNSAITRCCQKEVNTAYGYTWQYASDTSDISEIRTRFTKPLVCSNGMHFQSTSTALLWLNSIGVDKASNTAISRCCHGSQLTAYGFSWEYGEVCSDPILTNLKSVEITLDTYSQ